jgi:hypothetical protein
LEASRKRLASRFACGAKTVMVLNCSGVGFRTIGVENMPGLARRGAVAVNPGFAAGTNARLLETLASGSKSLEPIGVGL